MTEFEEKMKQEEVKLLSVFLNLAVCMVDDRNDFNAIAAELYDAGYRLSAKRDDDYDKIMKVNMWLMEKYGENFYEYCGIEEGDSAIVAYQKAWNKMDEIYAEMNAKYPAKWYELGFNGRK